MNAKILKTGSSGNCIILDERIVLDVGVPFKLIYPHMKKLQLACISHQHFDHMNLRTIGMMAKERPTLRFAVGYFLVPKLLSCGVSKSNIDVMDCGKIYDYGKFQISPVSLFHDVPNYGFRIFSGGEKAIYVVDTGYIDHIEAKNYSLFLLESNHTKAEIEARIAEKQDRGEFSYELRAARNHLSREQAEEWLARNAGPNSRYVFLHQHNANRLDTGTVAAGV